MNFFRSRKERISVVSLPAFILASASPRKRELLGSLGLRFIVAPSDVPETFLNGETPRNHAIRLSLEKSRMAAARHPASWVLGADTVVVVDGEVLGKPRNAGEAKEMLRKLSGRSHQVITGFSLLRGEGPPAVSEAVESVVMFREIPEDELEWYAGTPEPYDKAGAYAVQGMGAVFVGEIHGSCTNVIGLPLCEVVCALKRVGAARFPERGRR